MSSKPTPTETNLPSFLVIGADPHDIEWLLENLAAHPDVYTVASESGYFSNAKRTRALGADWYASQFVPAAGERVIGEATLEYMQWRHRPSVVARKIERILPDVRLIAMLRNPVERFLLQWTAMQRGGQIGPDVQLLERLEAINPERDPTGLVSGGWYGRSLAPFRRIFGDRLLVVVHEDLSADPQRTYERVLRHIGAEPRAALPDAVVVDSADLDLPELSDDERHALTGVYVGDLRRLEVILERDEPVWSLPRRPFVWTWALPEQWAAASGWAHEIIRNVVPSDYERPTPNRDASVADLVQHIITRLRHAADLLAGAPREWHDDPREHPDSAFRDAAAEFAATVEDGSSLPETVTTEVGDLPSRFVAYELLTHFLAEVWELAVATGQSADIPERALRAAERFLYPLLDDAVASNPDSIPVAVAPPDDATGTERFVALLGRDPAAWRPRKEA